MQKYEKGTNRIGASRLQDISRILSVPVEFFFDGAPHAHTPAAAVGGLSEGGGAVYIADFLATSEGVQLNRAFMRIKDSAVRRRIVDLVTALAGEESI